ncbi:MAG: hypothetical protein PHG89_01640 [Gallionella sp.]|nr:hypothetical protein [Gallionella sp.]
MSSLFRNTLVFVIGYVILMIPTYLLPWLGSNSAVLNAVGAAIGHGMTPQWWAHAWCLVMLILMTWMRGDFIGKKYLPAFPFLAAVFDLTPGLSMIPLIPTALHLAAIILGVKVGEQQAISDDVTMSSGLASISRKAGILAGLMTAAAIFGSILFVSTSKKSLSEFAEQKSVVPIKSLPTKSDSPLPVAAPAPAKVVLEPPPVSAPPEKMILCTRIMLVAGSNPPPLC